MQRCSGLCSAPPLLNADLPCLPSAAACRARLPIFLDNAVRWVANIKGTPAVITGYNSEVAGGPWVFEMGEKVCAAGCRRT